MLRGLRKSLVGHTNSLRERGLFDSVRANFRLGAIDTTETAFFDGLIDEVVIYKKVLSASERTLMHAVGRG